MATLSTVSRKVESQLPEHFKEFYPRFINFIKLYYEWYNGQHNTSVGELEALKKDTSWWTSSVSEFLETVDPTKIIAGTDDEFAKALIKKSNVSRSGQAMDRFLSDYNLERTDVEFVTADGLEFNSSDDPLHLSGFSETKEHWLYTFGYTDVDIKNILASGSNGIVKFDYTRFIKLLGEIWQTKGTAKALDIFFSVYFGETITVEYPKHKISVLEDTFVLDGDNKLRDDKYWNEYSVVVKVENEPSYYQTMIDKIFKPYFHSAGFYMVLEKV